MAKKDVGSKGKQAIEKKTVTPTDGPYLQYQNKRVLDFSSQDFLGLSKHPDVKKNAIKYILRLGIGTLSPTFESLPQKQIEEKLAQLLGFEKAFFFNSLSEALSYLFLQLASADSIVFSDKKLATAQTNHTFSSLAQLESLLAKTKPSPNETHIIYVSSSSFDLKTLQNLAKKAHALLCFDDSEHLGIFGKRGLGFAAHQKEIDCTVASFNHVCGCPAAYIALSDSLLKEKPSVSSLSPSVLGALDAVLNILPDMESERTQIEQHMGWLRGKLQEKGFELPPSKMPQVTLSFSSQEDAERLWNFFLENDIMLERVNLKQISLSMTVLHTPDDLDQLSTVLKKLSDTDFALAMQSSTPTP